MMFTLAKFELEKWFKTGKIWKLLSLCQFILGFIFYWLLQQYLLKNQNDLFENSPAYSITEEVIHPLLGWTAILFFILTPLLATKILTEERKTNTLELYRTAAIPTEKIIMGKCLGLCSIQLFLLLPSIIMPLCLAFQGPIDLGQYFSGLIGLLLLLQANACLALFISSLCKEPLMAALMSFVTLLLFSLLEWIPRFLDQHFSWITEFALLYHCQNFLSGLITSQDMVYFMVFSSIFLFLSIQHLEKQR